MATINSPFSSGGHTEVIHRREIGRIDRQNTLIKSQCVTLAAFARGLSGALQQHVRTAGFRYSCGQMKGARVGSFGIDTS